MMQETQLALKEAGSRIAQSIVSILPEALVLLVLLFGALILAFLIRYAVLRALRGFDLDRRTEWLRPSPGERVPSRGMAQLVASAAYWTILVLGGLLSLTALDTGLPSRFAVTVLEYVPNLVAALLILIVGSVLARYLARAVLIGAVNMEIQVARLLSLGVKWVVLIVAVAMALDHIGIGRTVLLLAFGIVFGGIVLATSLAVGLGAKDVVSRALESQMRGSSDRNKIDHV